MICDRCGGEAIDTFYIEAISTQSSVTICRDRSLCEECIKTNEGSPWLMKVISASWKGLK